MKVSILSTFYRIDPAYSLCSVVLDQLTALVKHGYEPVLFTLPIFKDDELVPKGVEIRKIVPQLILEPYQGTNFPSHWKEDVKKAQAMFEKNMQDIDVLIAHDIFFIDTYLPYNIALREALPNLKCRVLAWTHSGPSTRPELKDNPHASRYTLNDNSGRIKIVNLNHDKVIDLAEMYGAWSKDVRVVHNARDPRTFWGLHPLVQSLVNSYNLLDADIVSTYPVSTPRMVSGKGLDKVIKIHANLKKLGYKTRLIVANAHANAEKDKRIISETTLFAQDAGLESHELIFTSKEDVPHWELGVPPQVVSDLFRLSNIFIFPTISENSSLVLLEAMLSKNLLVLNKKVGTLLEHARDSAIYLDFDYRQDKEETDRYYLDLAKIIASEFEVSRPLRGAKLAFQNHSYDAIFKREIEPILWEGEHERAGEGEVAPDNALPAG